MARREQTADERRQIEASRAEPAMRGDGTDGGVDDVTTAARAARDASSPSDLEEREGRFQRWLALISGLASGVTCLEVGYEHYRGSYSERIMYTPVILSAALGAAGVAGFFSPRAAKALLPATAIVTLLDGVVGFGFHVRGINRKPGGWRLPIVNMVMGPPIAAPLLFGLAAYIAVVATQLKRGTDAGGLLPKPTHARHWAKLLTGGEHEPIGPEQARREARFQRHLSIATVISAFLSGFEASYSHEKNAYRYPVQWTPVVLSPILMAVAAAAATSTRIAHTWLPAVSLIAILDGNVGFGFHVRGVLRRPGGTKKLFYNIIYGPPIFAPLLFAASGFLGVLASVLGRIDE